MNFQALAWMTRVVAQGKTTMARAIFRPLNSLFRTRASMKPSRVERTTTATVQKMVFLLNIIYVFNSFPIIWTMTKGDPANHTDTLVTYLYKLAFYNGKQGEAAAEKISSRLFSAVHSMAK